MYVGSRGLRGGNQQALHTAVAQGELAQVQKILEKGKIDINTVDEEGKSALHWAVITDHKEIAALLLRHGANTELLDNQGKTALDHANEDDRSYLSTIETLMQSFSTLDYLIEANLAGRTQNQAEIDQKLNEIPRRLEVLEPEEEQDKTHRHFKYRYHTLQASYLKAIGDKASASRQEKIAKKYKDPDTTGLATIALDAG